MGLFDHSEEPQNLQVDDTTRANLHELGRWSKFLAILMFIMMGLMVVFSIFMSTTMATSLGLGGAMAGIGIAMLYLLLAAMYFYPSFALYKYAVLMKRALKTEDQVSFNSAINWLKNSFKYVGIFMIILIGIYILAFIVGGLAAFVGSAV